MKTLSVKTQKPYTVTLTDSWNQLSCNVQQKICIVTDANVAKLYLDELRSILGNAVCFVLDAGEHSKSAQSYLEILSFLAKNSFTRQDAVWALGGGVVGDVAGFAAATYMRGIEFVQLPTTLLAMTDSSVGGKTAINLPEGKNLVGAFHQPSRVYANLSTLQTLPPIQLQNGMGEVVKYAFLSSAVAKLLPEGISEELIAECVKYKADIVSRDEKDNGERALLNLGHTVGHAVETLSKFSIPHGLCVAKGINVALDISAKVFGFSSSKLQSLKNLLESANLDLSLPFSKQQIVRQLVHDKKSDASGINFVLVQDVGHCCVKKLTFSQLDELL